VPDGAVPDGLQLFLSGAEKGLYQAIAPELLFAEAANVVLKKQRAAELTSEEAEELLKDVIALPIRLFSHRPIVDHAYHLAIQSNLTVYDALFLALAVERGGVLFTADNALIRAARALEIPVNPPGFP
jgi:predicted nucleic acid-binding protein